MRRSAMLVAMVFAVATGLGLGAPAPARADICHSGPLTFGGVLNPAGDLCNVVGHPIRTAQHVGHAITHPGEIIAAPFKAAGDAVMQGVVDWVGKGAGWLVSQAGKLIDETTTPRIESPWFLRQYGAMGALAAVYALPLLLLSILQGVLRRDGGVIVRAAFVQLPLAFVLAAMAVTIVQLLLQLTDAMSASVASSVGNDAKAFFSDVGKSLASIMAATGGTNPIPLFAVFLGALIAAVGAFFVWVELLIRSAGIYVAVLFLPFTFVAMIWPATQRWCRRLVELLVAIIFAKFVIVAIMALAAAGLGQSRSADAFQGVLAGAALMMLAAFSPLALLKLIPFAEAAVTAAGHRGGAGSSTLAPVASPAAVMRRVVDANWGGSAGGGGLRATPAFAGGTPAAAGAGGVAGGAAAGAGAAARGTWNRAQDIGGAAAGSGNGANGGAAPTADRRPASASAGTGGSQGERAGGDRSAPSPSASAGQAQRQNPGQRPSAEGGGRPMAPPPPPPRPNRGGDGLGGGGGGR